MSYWDPQAIWEGEDCYIIGGGPSLKTFDWELLRGRNTIGCNSSFLLGVDFCEVCVFGDAKFWRAHSERLKYYGGLVVTNLPALASEETPPWVKVMKRRARGLHTDALGWNANTGALAINLALLLGASRIFLLGFDMKLGEEGEVNWYEQHLDKPNPRSYKRFTKGFGWVAMDLRRKFPDRQVFNVTDDSDLKRFPLVGLDYHFGVPIEVVKEVACVG